VILAVLCHGCVVGPHLYDSSQGLGQSRLSELWDGVLPALYALGRGVWHAI